MQRLVTPPRRVTSPTCGPPPPWPFGKIKRRDGHVDRLEQGLREGIVSMLRRRTSEVVIDLRKDFKVIIYGGEFSAFKDFEKVIQVLELYRRREDNH